MSTLTFCTTICIMKEVEGAANSDWYIRLKIATSSKIHSNVSDAIMNNSNNSYACNEA